MMTYVPVILMALFGIGMIIKTLAEGLEGMRSIGYDEPEDV